MTQKVIWHPNMAPSLLLLYVITNEKNLKLKQIDRLLAASKIFPAETRSNNSGRYTCCYKYLEAYQHVLRKNSLLYMQQNDSVYQMILSIRLLFSNLYYKKSRVSPSVCRSVRLFVRQSVRPSHPSVIR